jgi:anti-anti-sigma regulatory factor
MKVSQRSVTTAMLVVLLVGAVLVLLGGFASAFNAMTIGATAVSGLILLGLLLAYRRGWEQARPVAVLFITAATALTLPEEYLYEVVSLAIFLPPVMALIIADKKWVAGSAVAVIALLNWRSQWQGLYADLFTIVIFAMVVGGMLLARLVTDTALTQAEENARRAESERVRAEQRAAELDEAAQLLEGELEQQRSLLTLVETLETPVVRLADGVLFAPVVGHLDTRRADMLMQRLLEAVHGRRARVLIIDIAGVAVMDTSVAAALVRTVQGLRMLGCEVVVSGIAAPVASSLVQLGASLGTIRTVRSPEEALALTNELN